MGSQSFDGPRPTSRIVTDVVVLAVLVAVIWLVRSADDPVRFFASAVSSQRASHSLSVGNDVLSFDARMLGVYLSFLCTFWAVGRRAPTSLPSIAGLGLATALGLMVAGDGLNSLFDDHWGLYIYQPANLIRFATGAAGGLAITLFIREIEAMFSWSQAEGQSSAWPGIASGCIVALMALACMFDASYAFDLLGLAGAVLVYVVVGLILARLILEARGTSFSSWQELMLSQPLVPVGVVGIMALVAASRTVT